MLSFVAFQKETFTLVAIIPPVGSAHRERGMKRNWAFFRDLIILKTIKGVILDKVKKVLYVKEINTRTGKIISNTSTNPNSLLDPYLNNLYNSIGFLDSKIAYTEMTLKNDISIQFKSSLQKLIADIKYSIKGIEPLNKELRKAKLLLHRSSFTKSCVDSFEMQKYLNLEKDLNGLTIFVSTALLKKDIDLSEIAIVVNLVIETLYLIGANSTGLHSNYEQKAMVVDNVLNMINAFNSRIEAQTNALNFEIYSLWNNPANFNKQNYIAEINNFKIRIGDSEDKNYDSISYENIFIDFSS